MAERASLEFLSRQSEQMLTEMRGMRQDMDMLIRLTTRVDNTINALRQDVQAFWLSQGELRRRLETLEAAKLE